jgi:hypothetical protein
MEKISWEDITGKKNLEMGTYIINWLQLWDDNPLVGYQVSKIFMTRFFHPLGYGFKRK